MRSLVGENETYGTITTSMVRLPCRARLSRVAIETNAPKGVLRVQVVQGGNLNLIDNEVLPVEKFAGEGHEVPSPYFPEGTRISASWYTSVYDVRATFVVEELP